MESVHHLLENMERKRIADVFEVTDAARHGTGSPSSRQLAEVPPCLGGADSGDC